MRPKTLVPTLKTLIENRQPFLLTGSPGIGKTEMVEQAAKLAGAQQFTKHVVVDEPIDYKGLPIFNDGKAIFAPYDVLELMMETDKPTLIFLDDFGHGNPSVQAAAMQLVLGRAVNGKRISDYVTFGAATNRREDRAGVSGIIEPMKSRFLTILEVEVNVTDWQEWALSNGVPSDLVAFIEFRPNLLNDFKPTADMTNSPSPRTVYHVGQIMQMDFPKDAHFELIKGAAGEGFATEFLSFLRLKDELPDAKAALRNPDEVEVPKKANLIYAFIGALVEYVSPELIKGFAKIVKQFAPEYQVVAYRMAQFRHPEIIETDEWLEFFRNNVGYITV